MRSRSLLVVSSLLLTMALASCDASQSKSDVAYPAPVVKTMMLKAEDVTLEREYPGRLAPVRLAEVRARVSGIVLARTFVEGSDVKAGDVLFEIDPERFKAASASAEAQVARTEAALLLATQQADRVLRLARNNVASQAQLDAAEAGRQQAVAEVAVAKANLRTTELELSYASVRSPIDGRIGPALVTEGAFARQEDGTQMAVVRDLSKVYVDFTAPLADVSDIAQGNRPPTSEHSGPVKIDLILSDGRLFENPGRLLFSSDIVNETTGQVSLRAEIENGDLKLLPGTYVRIRMTQGVARQALMVPQKAVQRDASGQASVILVKDGMSHSQPVVTGDAISNQWIVAKGLTAGDEIVVEGIERAVPESPVTVQTAVGDSGAGAEARSSCEGECRPADKG